MINFLLGFLCGYIMYPVYKMLRVIMIMREIDYTMAQINKEYEEIRNTLNQIDKEWNEKHD